MKFSIRSTGLATAILTAAALTACGGGGGDSAPLPPPPPPASAEGAYIGNLTNAGVNAFQSVVLETGQYWMVYGNVVSGVFYINGLIQGSGVSNNGSFTSGDLRDFGATPAAAGTLTGTYTATPSFAGTLAVPGGTVGFNGGAFATTVYNYNTPALQASIAGAWTLSSTTNDPINLAIAADGSFNGTTVAGCALTGTATPRPSGRNVYNVTVIYGGAPCTQAGQTVTGIGVYSTITPTNRQFMVALVNPGRTVGTVAIGSR